MKIGIGQPRIGKTEVLLEQIENSKNKKIIFDFNGDFGEIQGVRFDFEDFHPLLDAMNLNEVKVINAGYLKSSHCLYKRAEEILNYEKVESMKNIVKYAIERLHASWEKYENDYAVELSERMILKINHKQKGFSDLINKIKENDTVIITANNIFSDHLRSMIYLLLYQIQKNNIDAEIYADGITNMLFKGNVKLLSQAVDLKNIKIYLNSNKPSNIPLEIIPLVNEWLIFKNSDKAENAFVYKHILNGNNINPQNIQSNQFKKITILQEV